VRHPEHFSTPEYGILIPGKGSSKGPWGLEAAEYLDSDNPDFLREGLAWFPFGMIRFFQLSPAYNDQMIVEAQGASGGYHETKIATSRITWKHIDTAKKGTQS